MSAGPNNESIDAPCGAFEALILRAADGELEPAALARLDAHVATCAGCRAAVDTQRAVASLVGAAFVVEPPIGFATRVVATLEPADSWLDRLDFRRCTWRVSPVAAGLALAAWLVATSTHPASAFESAAADPNGSAPAPIDALTWDDAVTEGDLVSLIWQAEVGNDPAPLTQEALQ